MQENFVRIALQGTHAELTASNPTLNNGQLINVNAIEKSIHFVCKIGDGIHTYNQLPFVDTIRIHTDVDYSLAQTFLLVEGNEVEITNLSVNAININIVTDTVLLYGLSTIKFRYINSVWIRTGASIIGEENSDNGLPNYILNGTFELNLDTWFANTGLTLTRETTNPLIGTGSLKVDKDANNRFNAKVYTDFNIASFDTEKTLQLRVAYKASALSTANYITVQIQDIDDSYLVIASKLISLADGLVENYLILDFDATANRNYRLAFVVSTTTSNTFNYLFDNITIGRLTAIEAGSTGAQYLADLVEPIINAETEYKVFHVQHKLAGTLNSGTFTAGSWQTRPMNYVAENTIAGASLDDVAYTFTLPAGKYFIESQFMGFYVQCFVAQLFNSTDNVAVLTGDAGLSNAADGYNNSYSHIIGYFEITATKTFYIRMWSSSTRASEGFGYRNFVVGDTADAVYADMIITDVDSIRGPRGYTGLAATINVGNVAAGDNPEDAQVVNVGDENDATFDFVLPKGDPGTTVPDINALTELTLPEYNDDKLIIYDNSAGSHKSIKTDKLLSPVLTGAIMPFATTNMPVGWLKCNGAAISRTSYSTLFDLLVTNAGFTSQAFTVTIATPAVFTKVAHGFTGGERLRFATDGALPTGLNSTSDFFVIYLTADTFGVTAIEGSTTRVATSGTQSGTHSYLRSWYGLGDGSTTFNVPDLRGEFIRGYIDNAVITGQTGRAFEAWEQDAIRNITGNFSGTNVDSQVASGCHYLGAARNGAADGSDDRYVNFDASRSTNTVYTAEDNRPRNRQLLYCIKY